MDEMTINGIKYIPQAKKIAVDTGTSSVSGPTMDVSKINFMIEEKRWHLLLGFNPTVA